MGLYNSEITSVSSSSITIDIGQPWTIPRALWESLPGSQPPRVGDYWSIQGSSGAALLQGERPSRVSRTNDALDKVHDELGVYGLF